MLTEELNPKMTLEVASQLFELYLTLADIQRFWNSIPGRWVPCPLLYLSPSPLPLPSTSPPPSVPVPLPHLLPSLVCSPGSFRRALEQKPKGPTQEALLGAPLARDPGLCGLRVSESGRL